MWHILALSISARPFVARRLGLRCTSGCAAVLLLLLSGCNGRFHHIDTTPLDQANVSYDAIQSLKALNVTPAEITQVAAARQNGFSDDSCVEFIRIAREHKQPFDSVDTAIGFLQAGMTESDVLELARMNQLGLEAGELQAVRLAGLPDSIVLELARKHVEGKPVLSGPSLAQLMNTGMSHATLLELIRLGVPDTEAPSIIAMKHHRASDAQVLHRYLHPVSPHGAVSGQ